MDQITPKFLGYVGGPDLHDAMILGVKRDGGTAVVLVETYRGAQVAVGFEGVSDVCSEPSAGMHILGVAELDAPGGSRRYVFVNADEDAPGRLEIVARGVTLATM